MSNTLKEKLGLYSAIMVVISAMIGSGVFKKVSAMSADLHSSNWVILAWICAGLVTLMGSLSNAEIAGIVAKPGGQYVYFQTIYGRLFAFLYGWSSFSVIQTATAASVAYVFAESLNQFVHLPTLSATYDQFTLFTVFDFQFQPLHNFGVKALACGLVMILSFINYRGIDYGERIGNIFGAFVVIGILAIIVLAYVYGNETNILGQTSSVTEPIKASAFFAAMMAAFWAFEGWNNVGFLGGEITQPKKHIPIALTVGTAVVMLLYVLVNTAYFKLCSISFFEALNQKENAIAAVAALDTTIQGGAWMISILILVSTFNSTNNSLMTAPRIYYAMANDGLFHASAAKAHDKFLTPHRAIVYQMIWCLVLIISGSFDMLTEMLVFVAFMFYGSGAIGVILLRRRMPAIERPFKVPFYPILPLVFAVFSVFLVGYTIVNSPGNSLIGLVLVALGLPLYWLMNKRP